MDTLHEAYNAQQFLLRVGDVMHIGSPYYDPIITYVQVARLNTYDMAIILPVLQSFIITHNSLRQIEILFVGLMAIYNIRPLHYITYVCNKSLDQLQDSIAFAKHIIDQ